MILSTQLLPNCPKKIVRWSLAPVGLAHLLAPGMCGNPHHYWLHNCEQSLKYNMVMIDLNISATTGLHSHPSHLLSILHSILVKNTKLHSFQWVVLTWTVCWTIHCLWLKTMQELFWDDYIQIRVPKTIVQIDSIGGFVYLVRSSHYLWRTKYSILCHFMKLHNHTNSMRIVQY